MVPQILLNPRTTVKCLHFRFQLCSLLSSRSQLHGWLDKCLWAPDLQLSHHCLCSSSQLRGDSMGISQYHHNEEDTGELGRVPRFPWPQQLAMGEKKIRRFPVALTSPDGHLQPRPLRTSAVCSLHLNSAVRNAQRLHPRILPGVRTASLSSCHSCT